MKYSVIEIKVFFFYKIKCGDVSKFNLNIKVVRLIF